MKLLILAVVVCVGLTEVESTREVDPGYEFNMDRRLGHFEKAPFTDLYKTYAAAFVWPLHKDREVDDYRNYLPSGPECMEFFTSFVFNDYHLRDLDEFVRLDACLGYLYTSPRRESDAEVSQLVKESLPIYQGDVKLEHIYYNTQIDEFSDQAKNCIGNLFFFAIRLRKQYSDVSCNDHWIQALNNFGACFHDIPVKPADAASDSYLEIIYDLVKTKGLQCFHYEIRLINDAVRSDYESNPFRDMSNRFSLKPLKNQRHARKWPTAAARLLAAVQGATEAINLRQVANLLTGISLKHPNWTNTFMKNIAAYATATIKPSPKAKKQLNDPDGSKRYEELIDTICRPFRSSTDNKSHDYARAFVRMINMLTYPEVYGLTTSEFLNFILTNETREAGVMYLCASSCNVLAHTMGALNIKSYNSANEYKVNFKPNLSTMILWPNPDYF